LEKAILENHERYLERFNFYRSFGYDSEKERDFIIDKSMPFSGRILEIGTGKGHFALALAKRGFSFMSIDISKEEQEIAKLNMKYLGLEKQVDFRIENAQNVELPDQSLDTIISVNVFHHLEKPSTVLDEIVRLLRPAGKVVLSDFTEKGLEIINMCHTHEGRQHDYFKHRLDQAKDYFIKGGLAVKEVRSEAQRVIIAQ
jgi:2-polyprenyl-3-methyl-5-hydroxy-6-metoxy-1,4-benzoquinol methylase